MMLSDDELLHIEGEPPENYDPEEARSLLTEHGDFYRQQLVQAIHLKELVKTYTYQASLEPWQAALGTPDWNSGRIETWRDLAGALHCGLYLPGGICWDDVVPRV